MKPDKLKLLVQAGNPIISMETSDEPRAIRTIREVAAQLKVPLLEWSTTEGLGPAPPQAEQALVAPGKVAAALQHVKECGFTSIYLFKDLGPHCKDPQVVRYVRDLYFSSDNRLWTLVLLRMDPSMLYNKFIGESEARLREALAQAESMAPVVLWIDEIEKAFASAASDSADGGLSQRMFGTLLAWMQDHRHPIFLIATANDVSRLPPELMRKGRFDEVFFVDLPQPEDRRVIFSIHLRKRRRDPARFDLDRLVQASDGFSGAEIEQAVVSGLYDAFCQETTCTTEHVMAALSATHPLSVVARERVQSLREWARQRCVFAD